MFRETHKIKVVVITERWSEGWKRDDGSMAPAGWQKPTGWPKRGSTRADGDRERFSRSAEDAYHECTLHTALTHRSKMPAYLVGYRPTAVMLRLRKDALSPSFVKYTEDAGGVHMQLALFDVDNHDQDADVEAWWETELDKVAALQDTHPGTIVYRSKRGYRIVSTLPKSLHLRSPEDSRIWDKMYAGWCGYLKRKFDIGADVLLDWTRFQGVPHPTKEKGGPPLELEVLGDVEHIGIWEPALIDSDYPPERVVGDWDGVDFEGDCQLLQLVRRAGLRCEATELAHAWDICCPNYAAHSPNAQGLQDYVGKTVLYTNGPLGKIECKSSGCSSTHWDKNKSYFKYFNELDVEQTRPKPPIDVYDPEVLRLSDIRNKMCEEVRLDRFLSGWHPPDTTFESYEAACKNQRRLGQK